MPTLLSGNSLGFLFTDNARLMRQFFDRLTAEAGFELTSGEIRALSHVFRYGGSRQAALAERMGVEPMTLSAYLDRLEARGLVTRTTDPTDRRAKIIRPTAAAETVFEEIRPLVVATHAHATQGLSEADLKRLEEMMATIRANLTTDPAILYDRADDAASAAEGTPDAPDAAAEGCSPGAERPARRRLPR